MAGTIREKTHKVLQLGKFYPLHGGVEKVMYELMTGLSDMGVDCDMLSAACNGHGFVKPLNEHAHLVCCRTWVKACATMISPSMIVVLKKLCRRYDIIHVHHPDPMACLALRLSGYKGKVIVHWHSDIEKQKWLLQLYRPLQNWLLKRADLIVGTSPTYLAESPYLEKVQDKTVSLPIGIDPICPNSETVSAIKAKYQGRKIIFSLGRLVAYKGYRYLINAAKYLGDDYVILIGGSGPLMPELQAEIDNNRLGNKVKLLGRIPEEELAAYYGACTLFCLSSVQKTEAFGIVQIEAMSCGKPVVATNIPQSGVSWVNEHTVSGLNVTPRNPQELAEAIVKVTKNEEAYRAYSVKAKERYMKNFTKSQMINSTIEYYNSLWKE